MADVMSLQETCLKTLIIFAFPLGAASAAEITLLVKKVKNRQSVILSSFILLETRHFYLIVLKTVQSQEEVKHRLCCWRFRQTSGTSR